MKYDWYSTTKTALAYYVSLLILLLAYGQARGQSNSQQIKQGETPTGLQASEWTSIQKQMQMSKYKAYQQQDGSYTSANLAHGLQIAYHKDGNTTLTPRDCDQTDYQIAMRLEGIGYDKLAYLDRPAEVKQEDLGAMAGSKVTYQWNANLREWWVNDKKGLEQWFSLQHAPQGRKPNTPLHLRMALQTDMHVTLQNNHLQLQKGNTTLHYDKLKVWDATGKEIDASMNYTNGYIDFYIAEVNATYPLTIDPTWTQQAYIKASNTEAEAGDYFGCSVSISGETMVVGAFNEDSNATGVNGNQTNNSATDSGAAYIFVRSGGIWTQQAYLKASNTGIQDHFGWSVSISGETVVVGAVHEDSNATGVNGDGTNNSAIDSGAAYIFVRSGTTWTQQAYLKASNTGADDDFGLLVAISGETVVVGAHLEDSNATGINGNQANNSAENAGAAYIFVRSGTTWSQQAYLKASNTRADDLFGESVAISGETVVVGAIQEDSNATGVNGNQTNNSASLSGAVYIFVRSGTTWAQQAYLKASNTGVSDYFGYSVAISGETVVVGALYEASNATGVNGNQADNSASAAGAAYIFVRDGTTWTQQAYLKASNAEEVDFFGHSVAISEETVVVGAVHEDSNATGENGNQADNSAPAAGAAYIFVRDGTTWTQQAYLKASNPGVGDFFGHSVAISGETVVVGAVNEDSNATGVNGNQADNSASFAGAVYVFAPSPEINLKQNTASIANVGTHDFGAFTVNQSSGNITFTIENTGNATLNLTGNPKIAKSGTHANDFTITETLPATINASGSATFTINFTPLGAGTRIAQISIANNDGDENPYIVNLTGVGQAPEINLKQNLASIASGGSYDFGAFTVNQSSGNITFTVENTGNLPLNLTGSPKIVKSGTHANDFTITETLPATINASGSATFTINFTPSGVGTRTAQISVANNDSDENPYIVNLTGGGQAPEINLKQNLASIASGGSYDFGAFTVNQSSGNITFAIENTGNLPLNLTGTPKIVKSGTHASDFIITETLPATINASGSATFTINFTPSGVGTRTAQISIANNDSDENPYIVNLTGIAAPCEGRGIYPNPARNMLTISVEGNTATEIAVMLFDAQGKFCLQCTLPVEGCKARLPLQDLPSGLYLLQFQVGNEWITEKVVVMKS